MPHIGMAHVRAINCIRVQCSACQAFPNDDDEEALHYHIEQQQGKIDDTLWTCHDLRVKGESRAIPTRLLKVPFVHREAVRTGCLLTLIRSQG